MTRRAGGRVDAMVAAALDPGRPTRLEAALLGPGRQLATAGYLVADPPHPSQLEDIVDGIELRIVAEGNARLAADLLGDATRPLGGRDLWPCLTLSRMSPHPAGIRWAYELEPSATVYPCPACRAWQVDAPDDVVAEDPLEAARDVERAIRAHALEECEPLRLLAERAT